MSKSPWVGPSNETGYLTANKFYLIKWHILMQMRGQKHQPNVEHPYEDHFLILCCFPAKQLSVLAPAAVRLGEAPSLSVEALRAHHKDLHDNVRHLILIVCASGASSHTKLTDYVLGNSSLRFPVPSLLSQELPSVSSCPWQPH